MYELRLRRGGRSEEKEDPVFGMGLEAELQVTGLCGQGELWEHSRRGNSAPGLRKALCEKSELEGLGRGRVQMQKMRLERYTGLCHKEGDFVLLAIVE